MAPDGLTRSNSISQASEGSQTAQEFIQAQLQLEADAREALPYQFDSCTRPLGALRQILFACLTCNPPPSDKTAPYTSAAVCYSCSISCHGEHQLVELFAKRNFVCDCGTTRLPENAPCSLRINEATGLKGGVTGEVPREGNKYNQNFGNRFCGCGEEYDPQQEKGTMFQCLGLGTVEDGGCGEDWWHPECVVGLERKWYEKEATLKKAAQGLSSDNKEEQGAKSYTAGHIANAPAGIEFSADPVSAAFNGDVDSVAAALNGNHHGSQGTQDGKADNDDPPVPPGFPDEDDFEYFLCYKCLDAFPWIKRYASTPGFLPAVYYKPRKPDTEKSADNLANEAAGDDVPMQQPTPPDFSSRKRKVEDDDDEPPASPTKRNRGDEDISLPDAPSTLPPPPTTAATTSCNYSTLPPAPTGQFSLFLKPDFREYLCRCSSCFPLLARHPQLLEEEDSYSPPVSEDGDGAAGAGTGSAGTGSLLERGEAALSTMDRVRAIEGITAYNHIRDKVKAFLKPYAESGQMVSAEDVKAYFAGLRGDDTRKKEPGDDDQGVDGDNRKEQSGK